MRPNPKFPVRLVTFIEEILHGKLYFFIQSILHYIKFLLLHRIFTMQNILLLFNDLAIT